MVEVATKQKQRKKKDISVVIDTRNVESIVEKKHKPETEIRI